MKKIFLILMVFNSLAFGSNKSLDDQMVELAHSNPVYRNVGMLKAHIPLLFGKEITIFSASCVYLGDGIAITNAHCVEPWYFRNKLMFALSVNIENLDNPAIFDFYKVSDIKIHPLRNHTGLSMKYDLALLELEKKIPDLEGLKVSKIIPLNCKEDFSETIKLYRKNIRYIGYGTSGDLGNGFARNDRKKRASNGRIDSIRRCWSKNDEIDTQNTIIFSLNGIDVVYNYVNKNIFWNKKSPLEIEAGLRRGMSGGATLSEHEELLGINSFAEHIFKSQYVYYKIKMFYQNRLGKYLTALGIPMPFMNPTIGYLIRSINLSVHMDWIQDTIQDLNSNIETEEKSKTV